MSRLSTFAAAVVACGIALHAAPVRAAYCGPSSDTAAIEHLTVQKFNTTPGPPGTSRHIDRTYIMAIVVSGNYAESDIQYAGQQSMYFQKESGAWRFLDYFMPRAWPSRVRNAFTVLFNERGEGSKQCSNPNFVSRGSG